AGSRPGTPTRGSRYSIGVCGAADGRSVVPGHSGSGFSGGRSAVADRLVDAARRRADCCPTAAPCNAAFCRALDVPPFRHDGRRTRDARTWRLFCGCAPLRTQADPDSAPTLVPPSITPKGVWTDVAI